MTTHSLPILYQDDHLVAVAKPPGLFVHRSEQDRSQRVAALQIVRDQICQDVYTIHRLDRATSGVLVFGRTPDAASAMSALFARREVTKTYRALVRGHCPDEGSVDTPLVAARGRGLPPEHPHATPQSALTEFRTTDRYELPIPSQRYSTTRCSLVDVFPRSGRYHQIRRHFNYIAHPLIGDSSHGDSRLNRSFRDHLDINRLMLAAIRIEFRHPARGELVKIECVPNDSFQDAVDRLAGHACADSAKCETNN